MLSRWHNNPQLHRRELLRVGGLALGGLSLPGVLQSVKGADPRPGLARALADEKVTSAAPLRAFYASLTVEQKRKMCFESDRRGFTGLPLRLHVTNNWAVSPAAIASFSKDQQQLIEDVIASVLNPGWSEKLKRQAKDDTGQTWGNQKVAVFGQPDKGPCQMVVIGFHLTLRATCEMSPSAAFHGAICHGLCHPSCMVVEDPDCETVTAQKSSVSTRSRLESSERDTDV